MSPERKAFNLHAALTRLLGSYIHMRKDTSSEPMFDDDPTDPVNRAEKALFENRPLADWETAA